MNSGHESGEGVISSGKSKYKKPETELLLYRAFCLYWME